MNNAGVERGGRWADVLRKRRGRAACSEVFLTVPLVRLAWPTALRQLLAGAASLSGSAFLLSRASMAANFDKVVLFCGLGLAIAGAACLVRTVVPLVGTITVDARGIRLAPWPLGFAFEWSALESWQTHGSQQALRSAALEIHPHDVRGAYELPWSAISEQHLAELVRALRSLAPQLERNPPAGGVRPSPSQVRRRLEPSKIVRL